MIFFGSDSSDDLKNIINNFTNNSNGNHSENSDSNNDTTNNDSTNYNIDFETIMKMKSIMDALNTKKNDPRANLLKSLKPYLKNERKNKVDQYIQLLNMSSVFDLLKNSGGDKNA